MIGTLINGTTALVLPLFASYRALVSNDIALIRPWLMYWVVFASFQFTESVFRPVLQLVPFYGLFRMGFLLWLVLPQTQGAVQLYQTHIEPWLSNNDQVIDNAIARGIEYIRNSPVESLLTLFGISLPKPPSSGPGGVTGAAASGASSVTDMFMSRFRLPTSPDLNLAAYLPSILGNQQGSSQGQSESTTAGSGEYSNLVRNRLLGIIKSLETNAPDPASRSSSIREADEYDFVEAPKSTPSPVSVPGETEIEREVEEKLLHEGGRASATTSTSSSHAGPEMRRRWF